MTGWLRIRDLLHSKTIWQGDSLAEAEYYHKAHFQPGRDDWALQYRHKGGWNFATPNEIRASVDRLLKGA